MPFDENFLEKYKKMRSKDGLEIEPIEEPIQDVMLPEAPVQDIELPEAPSQMGMADSLALRSGDKPIEQPAMGMADSLGLRSGDLPKAEQPAPKQEQIQSLLSNIVNQRNAPSDPMQKLKSLDFSGDTLNTVAALQKEQENRKGQQELAMLARGLNTLGAGLGGVLTPGLNTPVQESSALENTIKSFESRADENLKDFQARAAKEKDDPNSTYSKGMRDFIKKNYGIDAKNASASQISTLLPDVVKSYEMAENRKARSEDLKYKYDALNVAREQSAASKKEEAGKKDEEKSYKRLSDMNKLITAEVGSSRSAFGKAANVRRSAEAIEQLVGAGDLNNLDSRQITEIARNLDAMLASGQATISGTKKLIPETFSGDAAKIAEYIRGIPKGAKQGEFVKRMMETVVREKELASDQIQRAQKKLLSGYSDVKKRLPDEYNNVLREQGVMPLEESKEDKKQSKRVKVSNGKETLEIDESDLKDAKKDGYNKV